jgi:hypothetical protein
MTFSRDPHAGRPNPLVVLDVPTLDFCMLGCVS